MAGKIDLNAYPIPSKPFDRKIGDALGKVEEKESLKIGTQSVGLVTYGILEATQIEGGYGWDISDYINFSYKYSSRPIFTWGLDGTAGIDWSAGGNQYGADLPAALQELTSDSYQPAIFIPRVIHWHMSGIFYLGCYILVSQVNSECTETDKTVRIHFRFEGTGFLK